MVNDGSDNSNVATSIIGFSGKNDAPIVDLNGKKSGYNSAASFIEEGSPVAIFSYNMTIVDVDNKGMASATVKLLTNPDFGEEKLSLDLVAAGVTVSYDAASATLRLTGAAPTSTYVNLLREIMYSNTRDEPALGARFIECIVNDGNLDSTPRTANVTITMVNDAPRLVVDVADSSLVVYTEDSHGAAAVPLSLQIEDDDDLTMSKAILEITNIQDVDYERLFVPAGFPGTVKGNMTSQLELTRDGTNKEWLGYLNDVMYVNLDNDPDASVARIVTVFVVDASTPRLDSNVVSKQIRVQPINDVPSITLSGDFKFAENTAPVNFGADIKLFDWDDVIMTKAMFVLDNMHDYSLQHLTEVVDVDRKLAASLGMYVDYDRNGTLFINGNQTIEEYQRIMATGYVRKLRQKTSLLSQTAPSRCGLQTWMATPCGTLLKLHCPHSMTSLSMLLTVVRFSSPEPVRSMLSIRPSPRMWMVTASTRSILPS